MLLYYSVIVVTVLYCSIIFVSFEAREIMKMPFFNEGPSCSGFSLFY